MQYVIAYRLRTQRISTVNVFLFQTYVTFFAGYLYDAVFQYAIALNKTLERNQPPTGRNIVNKLFNSSYHSRYHFLSYLLITLLLLFFFVCLYVKKGDFLTILAPYRVFNHDNISPLQYRYLENENIFRRSSVLCLLYNICLC